MKHDTEIQFIRLKLQNTKQRIDQERERLMSRLRQLAEQVETTERLLDALEKDHGTES